MRRIGRTDPTTPVPGRSWYRGAWRTPEEIDRLRERQRARRAAESGGIDRRKLPRSTPEEKEEKRLARNARRAARLRERRKLDPEFAERDRARQRGRYKPTGNPIGRPPVSAQERERRRRDKEIKRVEERRSRERTRAAARTEKAKPKRAPAIVRSAWSRADKDSIIRRKFPTMADLDASARRGDFDGFS